MDKYAREQYAVNRKIERAKRHDALIASAPKRKSPEFKLITAAMYDAHELLFHYDNAEDAPALAGTCETMYDAAVERLTAMVTPATPSNVSTIGSDIKAAND